MADDEVQEQALAPAPQREAETLPSYLQEDIDVDYTKMLQKFQDRAKFVDGVRKEAVARTRPHHWLVRRSKGNSTFNLMGPGAELIRTIAPIGFKNKRRREEKWSKQSGPGYTVYYEADVYLGTERSGLLPVIGSCSSDDDFFSTEHAEVDYNPENPEHAEALESGEGKLSYDKKQLYIRRRIPAAEVTKENIEKSALTNLMVNGITRVLGIRGMDEAQLAQYGIDISKVPGIDYGSKKEQSGRSDPATDQRRQEIKQWLIELNDGDEKKALASLKERTAFNDYKGCQSWDRMTDKQVGWHHSKIKAEYDKWRGEGGGVPPEPQQQTQQRGRQQRGQQQAGGGKGGGQPELL